MPLSSIAAQLGEQGWSVTPGFLATEQVAQLREALLGAWHDGEFRHAGIGRGSSFEIRPEIRNDQVNWLDPATADEPFRGYLQRMEQLREVLNQHLYLGLFEYEAHMAVYPPGAAYKKHLDQFRGIGLRTVTATLYLNEAWRSADGGHLRLYLDDAASRFTDIPPDGGTLVTFLSARFLHEVLPATRQRLSLTGWYRVRAPG